VDVAVQWRDNTKATVILNLMKTVRKDRREDLNRMTIKRITISLNSSLTAAEAVEDTTRTIKTISMNLSSTEINKRMMSPSIRDVSTVEVTRTAEETVEVTSTAEETAEVTSIAEETVEVTSTAEEITCRGDDLPPTTLCTTRIKKEVEDPTIPPLITTMKDRMATMGSLVNSEERVT